MSISNARKPSLRFVLFIWFAVNFLFIYNTENIQAQSSGAYLIPRRIFIGDQASLILPLPAAAQNYDDIILEKNDSLSDNIFPSDENIDFRRIILERRVTGSRLIIEFTSFVPGLIGFPAIEIGGERFSGLSVTVDSLISDRSDRFLSPASSALAMPGTALMLYGSMALIAAVILISIWFVFKGRVILRKLTDKWKRYRLFNGIRNTVKFLQKELLKGTDKRIILDSLSEETRIFLSSLTGKNCRAMTAREFENLQPQGDFQFVNPGNFFKSCDEMRFSGAQSDSGKIECLLADLSLITNALEKSAENAEHPAKLSADKKSPEITEEKAA